MNWCPAGQGRAELLCQGELMRLLQVLRGRDCSVVLQRGMQGLPLTLARMVQAGTKC